MRDSQQYADSLLVFIIALFIRLIGVGVTTITNLNTYAQGDAKGFAFTAEHIADGILQGTYTLPDGYSSTYHTWGTVLTPFWLVPGPSRIYARIGIAVMGAYAVYNVYIITRNYASREAAILAVSPMLVYPSFIFIHSSVIREAAILLGITTAARLLIVPPRNIRPLVVYAFAGGFLWFASIFRPENRPVFAAVLGLAAVIKYRHFIGETSLEYIAPVFSGATFLAGIVYFQTHTDWLARLRANRARGRTEYLGNVIPESLFSVIAFSWIGAIYFLFTPFPWMVSTPADFVALFESFGNLLFVLFGVVGVRGVFQRNPTVAISLAGGVVLAAVLYGIGTANVGTAIRHRQMILWAIFIFGGIGIAERISLALYSDWSRKQHSHNVVDD